MNDDKRGQETTFAAADGWTLGGSVFAGLTPPARAVLIAPGTGFRQSYYRAFAAHLAGRGALVLTFDFRGIGRSLGGRPLRGNGVLKQHWGERDLPAALAHLGALAPGALPVTLVGHSAGGQLIGLDRAILGVSRIVQVAGSSGYLKNLSPRLRPAATLLLRAYVPLTAALLGYVPARVIGWGEDLPAGVARQWARWCSRPGYVENGFGREIGEHYYYQITAPILSVVATDDPIATAANVEDLLRLFPAAPRTRWRLEPAEFNVPTIGHAGFFRPTMRRAWDRVADWIEGS